MEVINGYKLIDELSAKNAGFCRWGFCEKDGRQYYIKEFLDPVYPLDNSKLSPRTLYRKREICNAFFEEKTKFYKTLSECRTGNVVVVIDFFRAGSKYYVVTDKIETADIGFLKICKKSEKIKETLIRAIVYSIAKLHSVGIVHSDIKPDNLLLKEANDGYYTAKIIDFDAGFIVGKIPDDLQGDFVYLSPEAFLRINGEDIVLDEKIDIFSLGVLFHQCWTGKLPVFPSEYRYVFEAVLDDAVISLNNTIPSDFQNLIMRMLAKEPTQRPSADEILDFFRKKDGNTMDNSVTTKSFDEKKAVLSVPDDLD